MADSDQNSKTASPTTNRLVIAITWLIALSLVTLAAYLSWSVRASRAASDENLSPAPINEADSPENAPVEMPGFITGNALHAIPRYTTFHTIIPNRPRQEVTEYTVGAGDSVFGIAQKFGIAPETILWANYEQLNDNPDMLSPGMVLNIPPVDGVYYQWEAGDTLEGVAARFKAMPKDAINWPGNRLDLVEPQIATGQWILFPGGEREFRSWVVPTIPRGKAGVSKSVYGPGACEGGYEGAYGTGSFVWPTNVHALSGNDYWSGHLGIDLAGGLGDNIYAADSGVIVFAGWATGGYGYMIMIDHGNGYQTLYAHLSAVKSYCGQSVYQGGYIGAMGSTGNSTGPHLHFEVRYGGGFLNPWHVLPAP